jgi:hypothetical protein
MILTDQNYFKIFRFNIGIIIFLLFSGCSGCVESGRFVLDEKSKLPVWFDKNHELSRSNYNVEIIIYEEWSNRPGKIKFIIKELNNKVIDKATGLSEWHPITSKRIENGNAFPPNWSIVRVRGTEEIYEQSELNNILKIVPASTIPEEP